MQILMEQIQEYFNCHLERRVWQRFPEPRQKAAAAMAEKDIFAALNGTADSSELLVFCAICEQALFLLKKELDRQEKELADAQSGEVKLLKSETIEGLGRREYFEDPSEPERLLAPRAELFLARLNKRTNCSLSRG